jgi:hypothetical protein
MARHWTDQSGFLPLVEMNISQKIEDAVRALMELGVATEDQARLWIQEQIRLRGEDAGIARAHREVRWQKLVHKVADALGSRASKSVWDEEDEGFRIVRKGIDVVVWLNAKIDEGLSDAEILEAARRTGASGDPRRRPSRVVA